MENKRDSREIRKIRLRNLALSVLVCLICGMALIIPMRNKAYEAYSFESAASIEIDAVRAEYAATGENEALYQLALALCRQAYLEGEAEFDSAELCECGRELYSRAKVGTLDLEKIGDPADTTAMLNLLKDYGVTAMES
ncbi:MAG: hypothetical protein IJA26_06220 [Clostridia bacterium]|nr:hypothetical protein [Clostridia bacterium]